MTEAASPPRVEHHVVHPTSLLFGLVTMALAFALVVFAAQPPAAKSMTAPANEFSSMRALQLLERLLGDRAPHPTGSEANAQVASRISDELTALGYSVETQTTFACRTEWAVCGEVTNVLSRLPGQRDGPAVLLTAHYDSVAAGPGAADDLAGVAAILEIARILRAEPPPRNPVIFLLSDGEEPGLLGAEAFTAEHPWAEQVGVVVNLEANGTHGQSVLFETTEHNAWLIDGFATQASRPVASSLFDLVYTFLPFNTDLTVYEETGLPGLNFAFTEEHPQYHTPLDRLANVDPSSVQHHGDNALAAVRAFAARDLTNPPVGKSVYQDVLPGVVLRWPDPWTVPIALACAAAWLGLTAVTIRRGALRIRSLLWGLLVLPLGALAATLLGQTLGMGVSLLTGVAAPWYAHPLPIRVALWAGALLSLAVVTTAVARRAGFRGLLLGVWLWWSVLSLIVAALAPGASVLFVLPTILAALVVAAVGVSPLRASPRAWELAAVVALFGASWVWFPLTRGSDYAALDAYLGPMLGFAVGMAGSALMPLLALPARYDRPGRWALVGLGLLMVVAAGVALRVPVSSESRPQRLNLLHVEDRSVGRAMWAIDSPWLPDNRAADAPASLLQTAHFGEEPVAVLPWSSRHYLVSPAPGTAAPAAAVDVRVDRSDAAQRTVHLEVHSPRGAGRLLLYVPEAVGLHRIDVVGTPYSIAELPMKDGYQRFQCVASGCNGRSLALHLASAGPATLFVVTALPGLPADGAELVAARPSAALPSGDGDTTLIVDSVFVPGS